MNDNLRRGFPHFVCIYVQRGANLGPSPQGTLFLLCFVPSRRHGWLILPQTARKPKPSESTAPDGNSSTVFGCHALTGERRRPSQVNHCTTLSKASSCCCWCPTHLAMTARSESRSGGQSQSLLLMESCYWFVLLVLTVHSNSPLNSHKLVGGSISRLKVELINNQVSIDGPPGDFSLHIWRFSDFLFTGARPPAPPLGPPLAPPARQPTVLLLRQLLSRFNVKCLRNAMAQGMNLQISFATSPLRSRSKGCQQKGKRLALSCTASPSI